MFLCLPPYTGSVAGRHLSFCLMSLGTVIFLALPWRHMETGEGKILCQEPSSVSYRATPSRILWKAGGLNGREEPVPVHLEPLILLHFLKNIMLHLFFFKHQSLE